MGLVLGTNCGFCLSAPSSDPAGTENVVDGFIVGFKVTFPDGYTSIKVTEIGWWQDYTDNEAADWYAAIYTHDAVNNRPDDLIGAQCSGQSTTPNSASWNKYSGLEIILNSTDHAISWIAFGVEAVTAPNGWNRENITGERCETQTTTTGSLADPWGTGTVTQRIAGVYALFEEYVAPSGLSIPIVQAHYRRRR